MVDQWRLQSEPAEWWPNSGGDAVDADGSWGGEFGGCGIVVVMARSMVAGEGDVRGSVAMGRRFCPVGEPVGVVPGLAAVLVRTARAARAMTVGDVAVAAGCGAGLVGAIEDGEVDPTLDTVGRIVNSIGFELRAGPGAGPDTRYMDVNQAEVERLAAAYQAATARAADFGWCPPGPPEGTQRDWDGQHAAPPWLFGAGRTRRDKGGWAAMLVRSERARVGLDRAGLAAAAGMGEDTVARVEQGSEVLG